MLLCRKELKLRVRELRLERGWSLKELASRAGVTEKTLIDLEHERHPARPKTVKKVADALGVSVRDLKEMTPQFELEPPVCLKPGDRVPAGAMALVVRGGDM